VTINTFPDIVDRLLSGGNTRRWRVSVTCQHCSQEILPRQLRDKVVGRARRFCSNKCRQAAFRNAKFARRYRLSDALRNDKNTLVVSTACNDFAGRASPEISSETWRKVRDIEQRWSNHGEPVVSADGVQCFVVGKLRRAR
jgi:hypothetical protein